MSRFKTAILVFINSIWIGLMLLVKFDIFDTTSVLQNIATIVLVFALLCTLFCAFKMGVYQKIIANILLWAGVLWFAGIVVLFYILSNGFRDYKSYCAHFIPLINSYYLATHEYPESLDIVDDKLAKYIRYTPKKCGYRHGKSSYGFYFSEGFSIYGYNSKTKKWWQD